MKKHEGLLVRELREKAGWFISDLCDQIARRYPDASFDPASISRFERGKQELSNERLDMVLSVFNLTRGSFYTLLESGGEASNLAHDASEVVRIPRVRSAQIDEAGEVQVEFEPRSSWCPFIADELERRQWPLKELVTIVVPDNSLGATVRKGEIALVNRAQASPSENDAFAIVSPGGCRFRRMQADWAGGWMMAPESDSYSREPFDAGVAKILGRVVWRGGFVQ